MKNKLIATICFLSILIIAVALGTTVNAATQRYRVGYGIRDINPWVDPADHTKGVLPVELSGNGNNWERPCDGFMDDNDDGVVGEGDGLFTTATAITDPYGKTVIYITIDSLQGYSVVTNDARNAIVNALGKNVISADQIMVNANHTHSGPTFSSMKTSKNPAFNAYYEYTINQIVDAALEAYNDRAEAVMTKGAIDAKESTAHLGYNGGKGYHMNAIRHYDVTSKHKTFSSKQAQHVAGSNFGGMTTTMKDYKQQSRVNALESDNTMYILLFEFPDNAEKEPIVFVNWRAHSTGNSGILKTRVSSDYANSLRANLKKAGYRPAFFQGASGNVVTTSTVVKDWEAECPKGRDLNVYGRILSRVAIDCIENKMTKELPAGKIRNLQMTYQGQVQKDSDGLLAAAYAYRDGSAALGENKFLPYPFSYTHTDGKTYIINSKFHSNGIINRSTAGDSYATLELNAIIFGDNVAFVTAPNEMADRYDLLGSTKDEDNDWLELIEESSFGMPFVFGYTNDGRGYIPFSLEYTYNTDEYYQLTGKGKEGNQFHGAGSYEANTSRFARGTGEDLIQTFKWMLSSIDDLCYTAKCQACGVDVEWKPIMPSAATGLNMGTGHFYLYGDMIKSEVGSNRFLIRTGEIFCLDLNGHKMETQSRSFYLDGTGATLNLMDSVGTGHVISYSGGNNVGGGAVSVGSSTTFNMYGGTLQFIKQELPPGKYETGNGGVIACVGTTNIYGGTVIGGELSHSSYYSLSATTAGCGGAIYVTGKLNVYGGRVVAGKAAPGQFGDCIYLLDTGDRITISGDAVIDEIYINDNSGSQLTVNGNFTGSAGVRFNPEKDTTLKNKTDVGNSTEASFTAENLYTVSHPEYTFAVSGKNIILSPWEGTATAVVATASGNKAYPTLEGAVAKYRGGKITLLKDSSENVTFKQNTNLDLNGFSITGKVTVENEATLYCYDSETDDYTVKDGKYGKLLDVTGMVAGLPDTSDCAIDGYLMLQQDGAYSFHRVNLRLSAMVLRPENAGLYYSSKFAADEVVAEQIKQYGVAVSIHGIPSEETISSQCARTWYYDFASGSKGNTANGALVKNIMSLAYTAEENAAHAMLPLYGRAYIRLRDGSYIFGAPVERTLRQQIEDINNQWSSLKDVQKNAMVEMYNTYAALMQEWKISSIIEAATMPAPKPADEPTQPSATKP